MNEKEEIDTLLCRELMKIRDDRRFVVGAMSFARTLKSRKKLLDFVLNGKDVTHDSVLEMAVRLSRIERNLPFVD